VAFLSRTTNSVLNTLMKIMMGEINGNVTIVQQIVRIILDIIVGKSWVPEKLLWHTENITSHFQRDISTTASYVCMGQMN
jgi:hypothetical protein